MTSNTNTLTVSPIGFVMVIGIVLAGISFGCSSSPTVPSKPTTPESQKSSAVKTNIRREPPPTTTMKGLEVGKRMHDFGLRRLDTASGKLKEITWLSDFVGGKAIKGKKKVLILNFYATWCKPCLAELPHLQRLYKQHADEGLQILSVNFRNDDEKVDTTIKATLKIIETNALTFPILFDRYTNRNQLIYMGSEAVLPCNIVINGDGVVIGRFQGARTTTLQELEELVVKELGAGGSAQ